MEHPIPLIYRITFNFLEPAMAFGGILQIHLDAPSYLAIANPNVNYHPTLQPLMSSIFAGWLIIVFNDLVTLRVFSRDVQVWRCILSAHLLSDLANSYAIYQDLGTARFFNPLLWNSMDWLLIGTTIPPMVLKVAYILGVGVEYSKGRRRNDEKSN